MPDIFDTEFEGKDIEIEDNRIEKGADINLTAKDPTLQRLHIGFGWDINSFDADTLDMDVSAFLLDKEGQTRADEDFVFYNNMEACEGGIRHDGDSRTGAGEGDDESIAIDLHSIPFDIVRVLFIISIYQGNFKEQNIGMVRNSYIRVINADTTHEILRYELKEELEGKKDIGLIVGALDREGPKWHFKSLGEPVAGGLVEAAERYGIIVGQS